MTLTSGTRLGGYEVVALLGTGGMGEVYRAITSVIDEGRGSAQRVSRRKSSNQLSTTLSDVTDGGAAGSAERVMTNRPVCGSTS